VLGDTGPKVRAMQVRLGVHGHAVRTDGVFGPVTDRAVRTFQHDAGLRVDGIVGTKTRAALAKPAPKKAEPPTKTATPATAPTTTTTPDSAALLALARDHAAARSDAARTPLVASLSPTTTPGAFANPVVLTAATGTVTWTAATDAGGSATAVALAALLTLTAALGATAVWVLRRRRAG
jgi:peptidoglycan hydrolase-like protein with peptidoglycan-binding domain